MQDDILLYFDISSHNNSAATDDVKKSVKMCNFSPFNAAVSKFNTNRTVGFTGFLDEKINFARAPLAHPSASAKKPVNPNFYKKSGFTGFLAEVR